MRAPWWFSAVCLALTACASAKPELRGPNEAERAQIDQALAPLVAASGICQSQEKCPIGVGVIHLRRIDMAVGPHPPNKFGLTITSGALRNLQPSELQAALAHELGHVQLGHFDTRAERRRPEPPRPREVTRRCAATAPSTARRSSRQTATLWSCSIACPAVRDAAAPTCCCSSSASISR